MFIPIIPVQFRCHEPIEGNKVVYHQYEDVVIATNFKIRNLHLDALSNQIFYFVVRRKRNSIDIIYECNGS